MAVNVTNMQLSVWVTRYDTYDPETRSVVKARPDEDCFMVARSAAKALEDQQFFEYVTGRVAYVLPAHVRKWKEVNEDRYEEALNVLPPLAWVGYGFLVGEPWDHCPLFGFPRFTALVCYNGRFYEGMSPIGAKEWRALNPAVDVVPHVIEEKTGG